MTRRNLSFGGVWIRNENLPSQQISEGFTRIYAYPVSRTTGNRLEENFSLHQILSEEFVFSAPNSEKLCHTLGLHYTPSNGFISVFRLDEIGFLTLVSASNDLSLDDKERNKLRDVIKKLSVSLKGCLYHEKSVQDLITITKTQKELESAKKMAEESEQLKSAFLANMSHEIRTPVNAIVGFANLLSGSEISPEQKDNFIKHIYNNSKGLLKLISDIIDFSKIEAQQLNIYKETHYVNPVLYDIYQNYDSIHNQNNRPFQFKIQLPDNSDNNRINTDLARFQQIFNNLLANAFKFTHEGCVEMGYYYSQEEGEPIFYVKDTGIGISESKQRLVFESFRQLEQSSTRKYGGSGLGLAINKKLIDLLGGKMWLESQENVGSCFYFTVSDVTIQPQRKLNSDSKPQNRTSEAVSIYDFSGKNVLIAEDVKSNFHYLTAIIEMTNAQIIWAKNGEEAVAKCIDPQLNIDLVLMDLRMPVLNGIEAIQQIREKTNHVPIIVQTAFAMSDEKEKSYQVGANEFVTKPIDPQKILQLLKKYL
ncbi:MAG: response regulator [Marinifilaceae bacterium]